jgi:hypothetical protein
MYIYMYVCTYIYMYVYIYIYIYRYLYRYTYVLIRFLNICIGDSFYIIEEGMIKCTQVKSSGREFELISLKSGIHTYIQRYV